VARVLAEGLLLKASRGGPACVVYAAENHNHAAEILREKVQAHTGGVDLSRHVQFLNTVIGKMSQVLASPAEGGTVSLVPMTPDMPKTILVEAFNRILISRITLPGFQRGLTVLAEKDDLLPFEEAKLYGHNATHALLGYLAHERGLEYMSDAAGDETLMRLVRDAFLVESGGAMLARHRGVDALFTEAGYRAYVDDLMIRMVNPYLRDRVDRIIRDPRRKLGWDDRLVGTMRRVLEAGIEPERYARGAMAALNLLKREHPGQDGHALLLDLWVKDGHAPAAEAERMAARLAP
jgi:mannitol-1-phosphate 5-dehydrogenase